MSITRRGLLAGMAAFLGAPAILKAQAQAIPIVFVHGNGDHAALWQTTLWRFESHGWPAERLHAFNFTDPLSRNDDAVPMPGRSGTEDQLRELAAAVEALKARTGAGRVALIANSRGGNAVRNYVVENGGSAHVSHAILCGVPNQGVFRWPGSGSEFNGLGPFLSKLNGRDTDVVPGTAFLTIRSEGNDKFAQPDGRFVGRAGTPTGVTSDGPMLRGATNVALGDIDHRETAYGDKAFREMLKFLGGGAVRSPDVTPQARVTLDGLVTGNAGGVPTNRPVAGAKVSVFKVDAATGQRAGATLLDRTTAADGRWGPLEVGSGDSLEFVLAVDGHPVTHIYRSPFARSSSVIHLRGGRPLAEADRAAGAVVMLTRPRGYFGLPRDVIRLDGKEPEDVARGVATDATTTVRLPAADVGRAVVGQFRDETIAVRAWPVSENRLTIAELTW